MFLYLSTAMDLRLLLLLPLLCFQIRAEESSSIFFIDSPKHQFLRTSPSDVIAEASSMSLSDVGAAISVLLGFSPPATLSADSSSKLNEVLSPNPFNRPRAVIMLELNGIEDQQKLMDHLGNVQVGSATRSKVLVGSAKTEIQLPGKDEISVISLDESVGSKCDARCIDKQLQDLASWLGGSYVNNAGEPLKGEFTVSLANGQSLSLHMSEEADREFVVSVISLVHSIRRAIGTHEDLHQSINSPAELMIGSFSGLKVLQEKYGHDGVSQQGMELLLTTLTKLFDSVQEAYKGQIVGVFFCNEKPNVELGSLLNVKLASRPSRRLVEAPNSTDPATLIAEVVLVRRTLAWITGIIFILSTLIGVYYLLYMPLTRDTLLYSNVKLD